MGQSIQEWSSKICGRQPLKKLKGYGLLRRLYPFKLFKDCFPQILLGPFLNILFQILVTIMYFLPRKTFFHLIK